VILLDGGAFSGTREISLAPGIEFSILSGELIVRNANSNDDPETDNDEAAAPGRIGVYDRPERSGNLSGTAIGIIALIVVLALAYLLITFVL
jgi:hypothetical protein